MTTARVQRKLIGHIDCPVCETPGADVREDTNGRAYVVGDCCVSLTRTSSRSGSAALRKRMIALREDAPPQKEKEDTPPAKKEPPAEAAASGFIEALSRLGGR